MTGQQKLFILWACLLLMATLCPGAESKRGGFWGRGKGGGGSGGGNKAPPSQSRGFSKQGLKLAGAAAAGALGGAATGYGLGLFGKTRHGSSHKTNEKDKFYQGFQNKSHWKLYKNAAAPAPMSNLFLTLGPVVPFLIMAWIRDI